MLQWITRQKFNQIDLATGIASGIFFGHEQYLVWLAIIILGPQVSVACEQWAKIQASRHN